MSLTTEKQESLSLIRGQHVTAMELDGGHENLFWLETKTGRKPVVSFAQNLKDSGCDRVQIYILALLTFSRYFYKGDILY